jgi:hypothetical protein
VLARQNNCGSRLALAYGAFRSTTQDNHPTWRTTEPHRPKDAEKTTMMLAHLRASAPRRIPRPMARQAFGWRNGHAAIAETTARKTTEDTTETGGAHDRGRDHIRHHTRHHIHVQGLDPEHRLNGAPGARK